MSADEKILVRTRTGKKLHRGYPNSSVTDCGHWQKVANVTMQVKLSDVEQDKLTEFILCEHCFPNGTISGVPRTPLAEKDPREMTFAEIRESGLTEGTDMTAQQARFQAAYLLRTMPVAKRFSYLSVKFPPKLQKVFDKVMQEGRLAPEVQG